MTTKLTGLLAGLAGVLLFSFSAFAHHGYAAYDMTKTVTARGTVTDFELINPHCTAGIDIQNENGAVEHWGFEFSFVRALRAAGWTADTLKPGDKLTIVYTPARNGSHVGILRKITTADGRDLPMNAAQAAAQANHGQAARQQ